METLWLALSVQWDDCSVAIGSAQGPIRALHAGMSRGPDAGRRVGQSAGPLASRDALRLVADLLGAEGLGPTDLTALCFAHGPGAFTSLRVAAGLVQGLGFALGRPVAGICSLAAMAAQSPRWPAAGGDPNVSWLQFSALDARMGEVYFGVHRCTPGVHPVVLAGPSVGDAATAIRCFEGWCSEVGGAECAGNGFAVSGSLKGWASDRGVDLDAARNPGAAAVLALARAVGAPVPGPAAAAQPVYVRNKIALDVDEQRALAADRQSGGPIG